MNEYPIIWLEIDEFDDETGVDTMSLVDRPATKERWFKFNENHKNQFKFEINPDPMKRVVTGPIMLADTSIYRWSDLIGPYYCKFSKETLFSMQKKYFIQNKIHRVNEMHSSKSYVDCVKLIESFQVGDRIQSLTHPDANPGSWFGSFFIEDEKYWEEKIMSDEFIGFSLEGVFNQVYEDALINELYKKIEEVMLSDMTDIQKEVELRKIVRA